jgi:anti-sigma factor (TIGR02949 family)
MDCVEIREQLYSYLDGELTVWRHRAVVRHLEHCPPCSEGYALKVTVRRVVAERSHDPLPPDVRSRILGLLASETPTD